MTRHAPSFVGLVFVAAVLTGMAPSAAAAAVPPVVSRPVVTAVSPPHGPDAGGTTVTVRGSGFGSAWGVVFGSTAATSFQVVSNTDLTAVSPAGHGVRDIFVIAPEGVSTPTAADRFAYGSARLPAGTMASAAGAVEPTRVTVQKASASRALPNAGSYPYLNGPDSVVVRRRGTADMSEGPGGNSPLRV